jgi:Flp pilus assembly protein TadG
VEYSIKREKPMFRTKPRQAAHRRRGALLSIELVLTLPVLILVTLGALEFSFLLLGSQAITAGANVGARQAALPSATAAQVNQAVYQSLASWRWAKPQDGFLQVLIFVDTDNNGTLELVSDSLNPAISDNDDELPNAAAGTAIQVTVNLPSTEASPDLLSITGISIQGQELTASFVTRKE